MKNVIVTPAILTEDPAELAEMVRLTETFTDLVHLDIMDGQFVPSKSISAADMAALNPKLRWKAHLMVKDPLNYLDAFKEAGAKLVTFHIESFEDPNDAGKVIAKARQIGLGIGIAINPDTPLNHFLPMADEVDSVLFMSVYPGFYGAEFVPEVLRKIMDFRAKARSVFTSIDGGVKEHNIGLIARTGVDEICVGSAVYRQPDPGEALRRLTLIAQTRSVPEELLDEEFPPEEATE